MGGVVPVAGAFPKGGYGGWRDLPDPPAVRTVNDSTGPFQPAGRFEYLGQQYDDLFKNTQALRAKAAARAPEQPAVVPAAQTPPSAWERFLDSAYGAAMTPLPRPAPLDLSPLMEKLKSAREAIPSLPEKLPVMPEWIQRYARENGLFPDQAVPPAAAPPASAPVLQQPERGMWDFLHPQGTGVTKRGFNDIYPPLGR